MLISLVGLVAGFFGNASNVLASVCDDPPHCFSWARENSGGIGYTGVKENRYVLGVSNSGSWIFQFM